MVEIKFTTSGLIDLDYLIQESNKAKIEAEQANERFRTIEAQLKSARLFNSNMLNEKVLKEVQS
jgi:hypothetical protein